MVNLKTRVRRGHMLILPLVAALALLITGCDAGAASTSHPAATATPSPTSVPKILYQADWTKDASQWKLAPGWKMTTTGLSNGGTSKTSVYIPYTPSVSSYTIEMDVQVNTVVGPIACGNEFGLQAQTVAGDAVYFALVACVEHNLHTFAEVYSATDTAQFHTNDYTPGRSTRTYTINVDGPWVTYSMNGAEVGTIKCARPTTPDRLLLLNSGLRTEIQRITITTP
ncbi:MAG TPA: hypothetical protein VFQ25_14380 [Ktedonobacterales bacterium]|nr:hypothetical protein [Ktedonobacterales bacterium]